MLGILPVDEVAGEVCLSGFPSSEDMKSIVDAWLVRLWETLEEHWISFTWPLHSLFTHLVFLLRISNHLGCVGCSDSRFYFPGRVLMSLFARSRHTLGALHLQAILVCLQASHMQFFCFLWSGSWNCAVKQCISPTVVISWLVLRHCTSFDMASCWACVLACLWSHMGISSTILCGTSMASSHSP
jgi:hypothetical protein